MKIGIFNPYLDDLGGGEKYMMVLAICLSRKHQVTVFWDNKNDLKKLKERFLLDLSSINISANIFSSKVSFLQRMLETRKYDVIIVLSDGSIPFTLSKKLYLHVQQPLKNISTGSLKNKIKLKRVNEIFFNSYYSRSFIGSKLNVKTRVIYPPVELYPETVKKENIILNVGRLRVKDVTVKGISIGDYKKQSILIETFKKMVNNGLKDWKFVLAISVKDEDKSDFEEIKNRAMGFPIDFLVNENNKKLWNIYNKSLIYWHASGFGEDLEKHPEYAEHFGISTVEAMGAGCVPVVINAGGQKEIVENKRNGFLWDTEEELIARTMELIEDNLLLERMSITAQKRAEFFAGDRFCREVINLIEKS